MSEPTVDRITLRREIAKDLGMPFFRRFPSGITPQDTAASGLSSESDTEGFRDGRLTQDRKYWKNTWLYVTDTAADPTTMMRKIVDFREQDKTLVPEYDFDWAPDTGSSIEIFSIHTPIEINDAIDDAIRDGFPVFFDIVTDETMIYEQDKLEYELVTDNSDGRGILTNPFRIKNISIERVASGGSFVPTATSATTLTNSSLDLSDVDTGWSISVFEGTGSGQLEAVVSVDSATGEITVASMTVTCDTTSQIRYWNRIKELYRWEELAAIDFDAKDYPNKMRLRHRMPDKVGLRFRIQYVGEPQELSSDTAGTQVPESYIKPHAMAKMLRLRARTKPGEIDKYSALAAEMTQAAAQYKVEHSFDMPDQTTWMEDDAALELWGGVDIFDPLNQF